MLSFPCRSSHKVTSGASLPIRRVLPAALLMLTAGLAAPGAAMAEPSPALDRFSVWLGGYNTSFTGVIQLRNADGSLDTGEQPLLKGHDDVKRARVDWLLFDRQGFSLDYYKLSRSQTRRADESFTIDSTPYNVNAELTTRTRADFGNLTYRWWFGSGDFVFGAGLGAGYYRLRLELDARATGAGETASGSYRYDDNAWAPLANLGLRYRISDSVRLYADASGVSFHNDKSRTTLTHGAVGVEWFPWRNLGVGAEYASTQVHYRRQDSDGNQGRINFDLKGPAVYLRLRY